MTSLPSSGSLEWVPVDSTGAAIESIALDPLGVVAAAGADFDEPPHPIHVTVASKNPRWRMPRIYRYEAPNANAGISARSVMMRARGWASTNARS